METALCSLSVSLPSFSLSLFSSFSGTLPILLVVSVSTLMSDTMSLDRQIATHSRRVGRFECCGPISMCRGEKLLAVLGSLGETKPRSITSNFWFLNLDMQCCRTLIEKCALVPCLCP